MTDKNKTQRSAVDEYSKKSLNPNIAVHGPKERPIAPAPKPKVRKPKK